MCMVTFLVAYLAFEVIHFLMQLEHGSLMFNVLIGDSVSHELRGR